MEDAQTDFRIIPCLICFTYRMKHVNSPYKEYSLPDKRGKTYRKNFISAREMHISRPEMYISAAEIYISRAEMNFIM